MPEGADPADPADVVAALREASLTVATAESLTAGLLCARLADVPGASAVLRGGVAAYATEVKSAVLDVDADLLAAVGPVHARVACQLAEGARRLLGADVAAATTGVAGPEPHGGMPAGTVVVAVAGPGPAPARAELLQLAGDRAAVRAATVEAALRLLLQAVHEAP